MSSQTFFFLSPLILSLIKPYKQNFTNLFSIKATINPTILSTNPKQSFARVIAQNKAIGSRPLAQKIQIKPISMECCIPICTS